MSIVKSFGYADSIAKKKTIELPDLNYADDYAVVVDDKQCCILTNITAPIDQPETVRLSTQDVNNVYSKSQVDPLYAATSKTGFSILVQVNDILRVTDTADSDFVLDLPISTHMVISGPKSRYLTADDILSVAARNHAALFSTGSTASNQLENLIRGAVNPRS